VQTRIEKLGFHCANEILEKGGVQLMKVIKTQLKNN
jgi:hypothetical protein